MKKSIKLLFVLVLTITVAAAPMFASGNPENKTDENTITVYSYDSFASDWGPAKEIAEGFYKKTGIRAQIISCGSEGELVSRLLLEGDKTKADFAVGISGSHRKKIASLFCTLVPFEFGVFSINFDTESGIKPPASLEDLTKSEYKKKFVLIDPRTSSVGLGLLQWTQALFKDKALDWWKNVKDNALTISESWSTGYGLYLAGEAPLVISYSTSPVYHIINEKTERYTSLEFEEGHIRTDELCGILSSSEKKEQAGLFEDYLLNEGQAALAVANSMYPVNAETLLPIAFLSTPVPSKIIEYDEAAVENLLDEWAKEMR